MNARSGNKPSISNCCSSMPPAPMCGNPAQCRQCGAGGRAVQTITLKHVVKPGFLEGVAKPGFFFCASPDCDVVYFHPDGEELCKGDLRVKVGLKESQDPVPVCYCFGFTQAMLAEEIQTTGDCVIPQRIAVEVKAGNCACETRNPQGSCCLANVAAAVKRLKSSKGLHPVISDRSSQSKDVRKLQLLSLIAILGAGVFALAEIIQPFYRSDRSLSDPYSSYVIGKYGFVQTIAFIGLSTGSFGLSFGLTRLGDPSIVWRLGRIFLMAWSIGVLVAAIFPIESTGLSASAEIHGLASMLSFVAIIAAMFTLSRAFGRDVNWRRIAVSSWCLALVGGGSFVLALIIHHPRCFGVLQRTFLGAVVLWIGVTAARLCTVTSNQGRHQTQV